MVIRFFANIREITGVSEVRWDRPASALNSLLRDLCTQYGMRFRDWCLAGDELGPYIIVLVNGRDCRHQGGIRTLLQSSDVISIFPMIAGGCGIT